MDTLLETAVLYIGTTTRFIQGLLSTSVNYVLDTVGVSPHAISDLTHCISKPSDQLGLSFAELYKQSNDLLSFDQFQVLLVKIFLLTLLSILIMIFAAWHIYGSPIADRFMYSDTITKNERNDTNND